MQPRIEYDKVAPGALKAMMGLVLSGLKALLEHNIILNLVSDRFPDALQNR